MIDPAAPERLSSRPQSWPERTTSAAFLSFLVDAAGIAAVWAGLLVAENVALGFLWRDQFSGIWELAIARHAAVPLAAACLAPLSLPVAFGWTLVQRADRGDRAARHALAALGATAAVAVGLGVTHGRHFASPLVRGPFVALFAAGGAVSGAYGLPAVGSLERRPLALAFLGIGGAIAAWLGDSYVLPRLYPSFHEALGLATLLSAALVALALRGDRSAPSRLSLAAAGGVVVLWAYLAGGTGRALAALDRSANLRVVLVEHAPLMGRALAVALRLWPRPATEGALAEGPAASADPHEVARSLDWSGADLLLVTIDALRADHVSAYGYGRATTPNIDALAAEGTLFESAYCPTPHTSYSITSMMTGKYLRPLLALGLGGDSEPWAMHLRRYGWRTAAFYPPAVFFIDQARFVRFEETRLGFEYAKVEFAPPALREAQVAAYLSDAPADRPLFLWVHFFEPHEPYEQHPEHAFSGGPSADADAYDSEIATADDGVGRIVRLVRAHRPRATVIVTADHGEEFGDHGGRYHGTTVYEEQVRVPLVIAGPGVRANARASTVVQTIDLLPTALSALGIPRPARVRGRDLGPVLAGRAAADEAGFAFAETDDYALVASGADRLICERRAAACQLFRTRDDPGERHDRGPTEGPTLDRLRFLLRATERDHGRYEAADGPVWPEALRRGLQGEIDAALDVSALLDDADARVRRKAAEVTFLLHAPAAARQAHRAVDREEDDEARRWEALALARMGEAVPPVVESLLRDPLPGWRRAAALALGERGDGRACSELAASWEQARPRAAGNADGEPPRIGMDLPHVQELLLATTKARCRIAVPALIASLDDVRARPYVADALGALGDDRARAPLLQWLGDERYVTTRPHEARALLALGVRDWLAPAPLPDVEVTLAASPDRTRLAVLLSDDAAHLDALVSGAAAPVRLPDGPVRVLDLPARAGPAVRLSLRASAGGVVALWLLPSGALD